MSLHPVLTVGHSNHSLERFLGLLGKHEVTAVVDVRSVPKSGFVPHFNRDALQAALRAVGIDYVFLGEELGGRSDRDEDYDGDRVVYARLREREEFARGVRRVASGAERFRIALMCSEKDPIDCHRAILVAPALIEAGVEVTHLHADSRLERHLELEARLLERLKEHDAPSRQGDLFAESAEPSLEAAYEQREREIAYRRQPEAGKGRP
ncbi:MAG: DUF488 domain-containing protein [Thermoanaerobaculia bacterium]|nr:DUF488 domain-containing protein [Thermoanaerobaculia bacterium]